MDDESSIICHVKLNFVAQEAPIFRQFICIIVQNGVCSMIGWHLRLLRTNSVSKFILSDHDAITHEIIHIYFSIPYTTLCADQCRNFQKGVTKISRNAHDPRLMYSLYSGISVEEAFCPYTGATQGKSYYCLHVAHVTSFVLVYFVWWLDVLFL